jgi:hypothetical protein
MSARSRLALLPLLALCLGVERSGEEVLAQEPPELARQLDDAGLVVMEDVASSERTTFVIAYVRFEKPRERAMALVTDPSRQLEWRPDLESVRVVETDGPDRVDEVRMKVMFRELVYRVKYHRDPDTDRISWTLDPRFDNALSTFEGFWEFYPMRNGGTLGRFGTRVDAGAAIPAFMQRNLTRRSVVDTMGSCRKWVDSDGAWRP